MARVGIDKASQVSGLLAELNLDCWLIWVRETDQQCDPALRLFMEGDLVWPSALLFDRDGGRTAIVGRFDAAGLPDGLFERIVPYDEDIQPHLVEELARCDPATVAVDVSRSDVGADGLTTGMRDWLVDLLRETPYGQRLTSAEDLIQRLRGDKTAIEVERIRAAVALTETIFDEMFADLRVGQTEREIFERFHECVAAHGADFAWDRRHNPAVDAGPDKPFGHVGPTERRTRRGHLLHFDFGVRINGYCADLQRMVFFGPATSIPEEVAHGFATVRDAIRLAADALRPGVVGAQVDAVARNHIMAAGYGPFMNALGHQVGLHAHDGGTLLGPRWKRYGSLPEGRVRAGNVFTLEPNLATASHGMISLEEDVLVTETGCDFLSAPQRQLICVER